MSEATRLPASDLPPPRLRQTVRRNLLRWFAVHARDLPWRRRRADAYAQWVAEIMLQQTQVATVIPYYERFMKRFPTVSALAAASDDALMGCWQGLGYYRRAEHLRKAARLLAAANTAVPDTVEGLVALPGVGRYTAGAVASIAFGRRAAAVDGNVMRVLSRLFHVAEDAALPATRRRLWSLAQCLLPARRCGDFNQALMDLGALVCVTGAPRCHVCPLRTLCAACRAGDPASLPRKSARGTVREARRVVAMIRRDESYLMVKRPRGGLWGRLWEFPNVACRAACDATEQLGGLLASFGLSGAGEGRPAGTLEHRLTHRLIRFELVAIECPGAPSPRTARRDARWVRPARLDDVPMSAACRKMLALVSATASRRGGRADIGA